MKPGSKEFLDSMAAGTVLVAVRDQGTVVGQATAALASYSIDPPSVMIPMHASLANRIDDLFGISILGEDQVDTAEMAWGSPTEMPAGLFPGEIPLVANSLAQLACTVSLVEAGNETCLIIADVVDVSLGSGEPLLWSRGRFTTFAAAAHR